MKDLDIKDLLEIITLQNQLLIQLGKYIAGLSYQMNANGGFDKGDYLEIATLQHRIIMENIGKIESSIKAILNGESQNKDETQIRHHM